MGQVPRNKTQRASDCKVFVNEGSPIGRIHQGEDKLENPHPSCDCSARMRGGFDLGITEDQLGKKPLARNREPILCAARESPDGNASIVKNQWIS